MPTRGYPRFRRAVFILFLAGVACIDDDGNAAPFDEVCVDTGSSELSTEMEQLVGPELSRELANDDNSMTEKANKRYRSYNRQFEKSPIYEYIDIGGNENVTSSTPSSTPSVKKIIGGKIVVRGSRDYVAQFSDGPGCGGMLIAPNIILTAAHCRGGFKNALLGFYDYNNPGNYEQIPIKKEIKHPLYRASDLNYDFMIVVLKRESRFKPVCITNDWFVKNQDWLSVMGFGWTTPAGKSSDVMLKTAVRYITNGKCQKEYTNNNVTMCMMCADSSDTGRDSCKGDSGGPIVKYDWQGNVVAVGVVSWGIGCAEYPGVYARISMVYNWINKKVKKNKGSLPTSCNKFKK